MRFVRMSGWCYGIAALGVATLTVALLLVRVSLAPANLVMLYVLLVALIALVAGRRASALASILAFLAYNYYFVPPLYTLKVAQLQDVIELFVLLAVALVIGTLVARGRAQAAKSVVQAERMTALYQVSQEISAALSVEEILPRIAESALRLLHCRQTTIRLYGADRAVVYETVAGVAGQRGSEVHATIGLGGAELGDLSAWFDDGQLPPEDELRPLLSTLAAQAALAVERTRLAQVALQTHILRESERLKSTLLSSVSHDLRTPLAVIKGSASNLLDESVDWNRATTRTFLQTINSEADRLNRYVRNLLEMSRLEAGVAAHNYEPVAITDAVGAVLARLRPLLAEHVVVVNIPPDLPDILADPVQLELVLTNLLENVVKYTLAHTSIDIGAAADGKMLSLWVADRGPGIPSGDEQRIFEKFYRAGATSQKPSGSGLGLAIAKGIIEAHGGRIAAENRAGGGALIRLELPLIDDQDKVVAGQPETQAQHEHVEA